MVLLFCKLTQKLHIGIIKSEPKGVGIMYKILVVDDEIKIRETIKDYFNAKGLSVELAKDGVKACEKADFEDFDLIILDVLMPKMNGIETCREIRGKSNVPILFLSALGEENDFLKGYSSGADDYIVKPFPLSVLYQKCLAMIARSKGTKSNHILTVSGVTIDFFKRKVFVGEKEVNLSGKDYELLRYLMENKNIVLNREKILLRIWGWDYEGDTRVVDTRIKRVRKALGEKSEAIKTVVNVGYCYEEKS